MALPVILVDSATGSDTQASGAGPATALFGTDAVAVAVSPYWVGLFDDPDLSTLAVDGSAVAFVSVATAGIRNFLSIAAKSETILNLTGDSTAASAVVTNIAPNTTGLAAGDILRLNGAQNRIIQTVDSGTQVTLTVTAGTTMTGGTIKRPRMVRPSLAAQLINSAGAGVSWAIGGKRASIGSTTSTKLFSNNSAAGDAMPGWIVEMQSGHAETLAAQYVARRSGDTTDGVITLRGAIGAATLPILTFSNNGSMLIGVTNLAYFSFDSFELRNSNATKTASIAINTGSGAVEISVRRVKITHATDKPWKGIQLNGSKQVIRECEISNTANIGLDTATISLIGNTIINNFIHNCGSHGIALTDQFMGVFHGNVIYANSGDGINVVTTTATTRNCVFTHNIIDSNTGDGIEFTAASTQIAADVILNNIFSNNGGYGINYSAGGATAAYIDASQILIAGNNFYLNTSGKYNPSGLTCSENETTTNPTFTNAAGGDFSIGTNLKAKGYPLGGTVPVGKYSSTYSYVDPGAAQRQEAGGGGDNDGASNILLGGPTCV